MPLNKETKPNQSISVTTSRSKKVKLATVVKGDLKAPFSIATTPRFKGGRYSFPWITPLYPWYVPYIAEYQTKRYQVPFLKSLIWRDLGLNPGLSDHWRTLYPLDHYLSMSVYLSVLVIKTRSCFRIIRNSVLRWHKAWLDDIWSAQNHSCERD